MTRVTPTIKPFLFFLALGFGAFAPIVSAQAEDRTVELNAIIRSLAPIGDDAQQVSKRRAIDLSISFKVGSYELTEISIRQLNIVAEALHGRQLRDQRFQIVGHTDASGPAKMNQTLSERRAASVRLYLTAYRDIDERRLISSGKGESELKNTIKPNSAENRRVEFILIPSKKTGKPVIKPVKPLNSTNSSSGKEKVIKW